MSAPCRRPASAMSSALQPCGQQCPQSSRDDSHSSTALQSKRRAIPITIFLSHGRPCSASRPRATRTRQQGQRGMALGRGDCGTERPCRWPRRDISARRRGHSAPPRPQWCAPRALPRPAPHRLPRLHPSRRQAHAICIKTAAPRCAAAPARRPPPARRQLRAQGRVDAAGGPPCARASGCGNAGCNGEGGGEGFASARACARCTRST
jgi:hypothetical protein